MEVIKFDIFGKYAFFNKSETNKALLTFEHIHKTTVKGILGALLGLKGYGTIDGSIQFLNSFEGIEIGIKPILEEGFFMKDDLTYTNTIGFSNIRTNEIIKENVLINPKWTIYINLESIKNQELRERLKEYLLNGWGEIHPSLGRKNYTAYINNVEIFNSEVIKDIEEFQTQSIVVSDDIEVDEETDYSELLFGRKFINSKFVLPTEIDLERGYRNRKEFTFTNFYIKPKELSNGYLIKDNNEYIYIH